MNIVVLAGGLSTERDVSINSGSMVAGALRKCGHKVVLLDVFMGYEHENCDIEALFEEGYDFTENLGVREIIPDLKKIKAQKNIKKNLKNLRRNKRLNSSSIFKNIFIFPSSS